MMHVRFMHVGKTLTDLQVLGCQLHQNAFGGRALPGPAGGAIAFPRPIPSRYYLKGGKGCKYREGEGGQGRG